MNVVPEAFTFHYVSIKSTRDFEQVGKLLVFTFHYVSIKSQLFPTLFLLSRHLHSTMYLLNLRMADMDHTQSWNLHSTMYLLNPGLSN